MRYNVVPLKQTGEAAFFGQNVVGVFLTQLREQMTLWIPA
jgi:hypothetical protein